jgi:hypothetical protein
LVYFQTWQENPVITSVAQIPIESIVFPPVTLCPLYSHMMKSEENNEEEEWDIKDLILNCSFTKNSLDTGQVCDRIQVAFHAKKEVHKGLPSSCIRKCLMKMELV